MGSTHSLMSDSNEVACGALARDTGKCKAGSDLRQACSSSEIGCLCFHNRECAKNITS